MRNEAMRRLLLAACAVLAMSGGRAVAQPGCAGTLGEIDVSCPARPAPAPAATTSGNISVHDQLNGRGVQKLNRSSTGRSVQRNRTTINGVTTSDP